MENYIERKKAYFERLRANEILLLALQVPSSYGNDVNEIFIDPQDELELDIAEGTITFIEDSDRISEGHSNKTYGVEEFSKIFIVDYFIRIINALKNKDNAVLESISEEIRKSRSIEEITEMYYDLQSIATNTNTMVAMGEYVLEHTGFDVDNDLSMLQFKLYFAKATEFIKSCMPSVQQSKEEMKKPESVAAFKTFVNIFHSLVERDYGNKNNLGK